MDARSAALDWQDEEAVARDLARHEELKSERVPWENLYRQVERRVDPVASGGFGSVSPGGARGLDNFDSTAIEGLDRYEAAIGGLIFPRSQRWHGLVTTSAELNAVPEVQRWCEYARDRLFGMRYAPDAGFETQANEDIRSGGCYGTAALWVDERVGKSLFYKALHTSECWIDEDYCGRVDTVHREWQRSARQLKQQFPSSLSPKMENALSSNKHGEQFNIVQIIRPSGEYQSGRYDWRGKPIESITIAVDEKWVLRRGGYFTMPLLVSRTSTSPRDKYGRSPAMKVIGTIKGANEMAKTILRAGHRSVSPPILFHDDGQMTKFSTKPDGLNPGMIDEMGRILARPLESGGQLPFGLELLEREREVIKNAFLDKAFSLLLERGDRMTATEVLEIAKQQGMLVAPTAGRMETEKLGPLIARELDIGLRSGQILPPPPVMREAMMAGQAGVKVVYDNPLSRMARAEEAAGFTRWVELVTQLGQFDPDIIDLVDADAAGRGLAEVLGVRPSWVATPDQVKAKRADRAQAKETSSLVDAAPALSDSALNLAKANQISAAA